MSTQNGNEYVSDNDDAADKNDTTRHIDDGSVSSPGAGVSVESNGQHPDAATAPNDHRLRILTLWLRALCALVLIATIWVDATHDWEAPSWLLAGLLSFFAGFTPKQLKTSMS